MTAPNWRTVAKGRHVWQPGTPHPIATFSNPHVATVAVRLWTRAGRAGSPTPTAWSAADVAEYRRMTEA